MSYEATIHDVQVRILRALLFTPSASFAELQKQTKLSSDHFTFHVKKLLETGYVQKQESRYSLTQKGKEYANRMDTDENEIEKQPKISVALVVERQHGDRREFIVQQRRKQPYFGYYGRLGGKVRWGESFEDAATRELLEETGMVADFTYKYIFRKRDYKRSDGSLLEDKLFAVMHAKEPTGELSAEFEGGRNFWMTHEEFVAQDKIFESARDFITHIENGIAYHAQEYMYDDADY